MGGQNCSAFQETSWKFPPWKGRVFHRDIKVRQTGAVAGGGLVLQVWRESVRPRVAEPEPAIGALLLHAAAASSDI